jgi:predicted AAA+ superfamily ATPase
VVVRGPRQIGKTIAQLQVLADRLAEGVPPTHVLRVQADELPALADAEEPILRIVDWYEREILGASLNEVAHRGERTFLFFDEIQNLSDWAPQIKSLVDHAATQVVITGSSALRIEQGRDSLAGRISTIEAGVLSLTEIASFRGVDLGRPLLEDNGLDALADHGFWRSLVASGRERAEQRDLAFRWFSERGGYPLAHERPDVAWSYLADQLNETVIKRVIQHDLRLGERGRKRDAPLLEEVFRLACRYAGQAPTAALFAREIRRALDANVGSSRIRQYLRFLGETLLLRLIEPHEIRLKKMRSSPKICLADHGLRASWLQELIPIDPEGLQREPHLYPIAGRLAESITGATLVTISNLDVAYFPSRRDQPEIDFVVTIGTKRVPIEIKYQRTLDPLRDTEAIRTFLERSVNNAPFGVVVSQVDADAIVDPRIVTVPLSSLMLLR